MKPRRTIMVVGLAASSLVLIGTGFSSWAIVNSQANEQKGSIFIDYDVQMLNGITINGSYSDSFQRYFYLDSSGKTSAAGGVGYSLSIDNASLDESLKRSNSSGGYSFRLSGTIQSSLGVFSRASNSFTYFAGGLSGQNEIQTSYVDATHLDFVAPFDTTTKTATETLLLKFNFANKLLVDYQSQLESGSLVFYLSISGVEQE